MKHEAQTDAPATPQAVHETLYDGADVPVAFKDGQRSIVKVRKLARSEFALLSAIVMDDSESAEFMEAALYCGKDSSWAIQLTEESLDAVLQEGTRLNFPSFARWFRRRARVPRLISGQEELVKAAMEAMTLLQQREPMNGSLARATGTPISGDTPRTS